MFGLMKYYRCSSPEDERDHYKLHYCGVCKTLGTLYGQKTRFLLNRDLVFLSELLAEISGEAPDTWNCPALHVRHCFRLPKHDEDIPLSLQIASTFNLLLARYKIDDNIADAKGSSSYLWKILEFVFSGAFAEVSKQLETWNFPVHDIGWWMREQRKRELNQCDREEPERAIQYLAEPTAVTTGLGMKYGAILVNQDDEADTMYDLGYAFGQLIYVLDALDDFEKDFEKGEFNAIRTAYHLSEKQFPSQCRNDIVKIAQTLGERIQQELSKLHILEKKASFFKVRLTQNLNRKLGKEICPYKVKCDVARQAIQKMTWKEKWNYVKTISQKIAFAHNESSSIAKYKAHLTFALLLICTLLMPQKALGHYLNTLNSATRGTTTGTECFRLIFMALWMSIFVGMVREKKKIPCCLDCCDCCECAECAECIPGDCNCGDCDCGSCDCGDCDCGGCDCCDCGGCDCG